MTRHSYCHATLAAVLVSWLPLSDCFSTPTMLPSGFARLSPSSSSTTPSRRGAIRNAGNIAVNRGLRMLEGKEPGSGDGNALMEKASDMAKGAMDTLTKPIEVSIPAAILSWVVGSVSLTAAMLFAVFSITFEVPEPGATRPTITPAELTSAQKIQDDAILFGQILSDLDQAYVDSVEPDRLFETGVKAMLGSLDPYTEFENNKDSQNLDIMTFGRYGGVGLTIGSDIKYVPGKGDVKDPSRIFVVDALEGYAWDAGMRTGDHVIKVDGVPVEGKDLQEITGMLRGPPGTKVTVTYERDGVQGSSDAVLSRKSVRIKDVPVATFMGPKADGIGYILLRGFAVDSGKEVSQAIESLQKQAKLKAVILDLRGNPGGLLTSAVDVAEIFLEPKASIVSTKGRTLQAPTLSYSAGETGAKLPNDVRVVVVTSGSTASAAEIVSGAVQDHDRGIVVGERTFGKGLVQQVARLPFETSLKLTVAKYYTPSGRCIQSVEYKEGGVGDDTTQEDGVRRDFRFGESFRSRTYKDAERKTFKTDKGRFVRDGGGVEPDFYIPAERLSELELSLLEQNAYTTFASEYISKHPDSYKRLSANPDAAFVDNAVFSEFEALVQERGLASKTRFDTALDELQQAFGESKLGGLEQGVKELKGQAKKELLSNLPAEKEKIKKRIESALRARTEPGTKRLAASLRDDKTIQQAVMIAADPVKYAELLRPGITITSPSKEKNEPQLAVGPAAKDTAPDGSAAGPGSGKVNSVGKN